MSRTAKAALGALLAAIFLSCVGCERAGGSAGGKVEVTGTVTFDGAPLPKGYITFINPDLEADTDAGPVTNGVFLVKTKPGARRVTIRAERESLGTPVGKKADAPKLTEQYIPAKYNSASELSSVISESQPNKLTFDLKSK